MPARGFFFCLRALTPWCEDYAMVSVVGMRLLLVGSCLAAVPDHGAISRDWQDAAAAAHAADSAEPFLPPLVADEWYTVTIANVSVGYMHTTVEKLADESVRTLEMMDVQVSRGEDKSRMAFDTYICGE